MTSTTLQHQDQPFGRLHRGLTSNDQVDWKEPNPKPKPVRRESKTWNRIRQDDSTTLVTSSQNSTIPNNHVTSSNGHVTSPLGNTSRVLEADTSLQLSLKANSILGGSSWTKSVDPKFVKLDSVVTNGEGEGEKVIIDVVHVVEQSVFQLTETEKYILKQIMNMTHERVGLQAHRKLAETHLIRVQTHMEDPLPSEISEGGYVHLPDRTKMKRHYMKKLGRKATKSEVQVPKECCAMRGPEVTYCPEVRRQDIKNVIIPLTPGQLPDTDFRFRHMFVVDMEYMEKHKVDLANDQVPVFSAAHPDDKYLFSKSISTEIKVRSKRLLAGIRIAFNNRLYWRDVLKGKSKPSVVLTEGETEEVYYKECERFINDPLTCRSMMYYVDVYDPVQEYNSFSQGYVGTLETSPRLLDQTKVRHSGKGSSPTLPMTAHYLKQSFHYPVCGDRTFTMDGQGHQGC